MVLRIEAKNKEINEKYSILIRLMNKRSRAYNIKFYLNVYVCTTSLKWRWEILCKVGFSNETNFF